MLVVHLLTSNLKLKFIKNMGEARKKIYLYKYKYVLVVLYPRKVQFPQKSYEGLHAYEPCKYSDAMNVPPYA